MVDVEISQPGFIRALVTRSDGETRVDWAHDSAWRFMPLVKDSLGGWLLHPVDLALNKVLALAGRDRALQKQGLVPYYGAPGGVLPRVAGGPFMISLADQERLSAK